MCLKLGNYCTTYKKITVFSVDCLPCNILGTPSSCFRLTWLHHKHCSYYTWGALFRCMMCIPSTVCLSGYLYKLHTQLMKIVVTERKNILFVNLDLRSNKFSPCLYTLQKTEAHIWENLRAAKTEMQMRIFICSRLLTKFANCF